MLVLKQTSPKSSPSAPNPTPVKMVPSASASLAGRDIADLSTLGKSATEIAEFTESCRRSITRLCDLGVLGGSLRTFSARQLPGICFYQTGGAKKRDHPPRAGGLRLHQRMPTPGERDRRRQ